MVGYAALRASGRRGWSSARSCENPHQVDMMSFRFMQMCCCETLTGRVIKLWPVFVRPPSHHQGRWSQLNRAARSSFPLSQQLSSNTSVQTFYFCTLVFERVCILFAFIIWMRKQHFNDTRSPDKHTHTHTKQNNFCHA